MIVYLMRQATFSAAHNYWLESLTADENCAMFGKWSTVEPHGHNYKVELTVCGEVDIRTGMVVNITEINHALKENVVDLLDGCYLNHAVPYFAANPPTIENIAKFVWSLMEPALPSGAMLTNVKVEELQNLWTDLSKENSGQMISTLTRSYDFCASHRLHSAELSDEENLRIFGKCNNSNGHGHNYDVEVTISGAPNPITGMIFSLEELDRVVDEEVLAPFDHKHLNLDTPEFAAMNPTSEMLAIVIWQKLARRLPTTGPTRLHGVVVRETARNSFEYRG